MAEFFCRWPDNRKHAASLLRAATSNFLHSGFRICISALEPPHGPRNIIYSGHMDHFLCRRLKVHRRRTISLATRHRAPFAYQGDSHAQDFKTCSHCRVGRSECRVSGFGPIFQSARWNGQFAAAAISGGRRSRRLDRHAAECAGCRAQGRLSSRCPPE